MPKIDRRQMTRGIAYLTTALLGQAKPEEPAMENRSPFVTANDGTKFVRARLGSRSNACVSKRVELPLERLGKPHRRAHRPRIPLHCTRPEGTWTFRHSQSRLRSGEVGGRCGNSHRATRSSRRRALVAHSMGSIEAVRYCAGRGSKRVVRLVLAAPVTPFILKTSDNPEGVPSELIQAQDEAIARDFPRWIAENEEPFFTPDTPRETRTWIKTMMLSIPLPVALACRQTISAVDLREDVRKVACPTLIVHGDKDASAPLAITGARTARLITDSKLIVYSGAPHGIVLTHEQRFLSDLRAFIG